MSGFYLNELLLKLFARHDSHPDVFALYSATLDSLKTDTDGVRALRLFEKRLLDALGYGLALERDVASDRPLDADCAYRYRLDQGAARVDGVAEGAEIFSGRTLLAVAREDFADPAVCAEARALVCVPRWIAAWKARSCARAQVMLALRRRDR